MPYTLIGALLHKTAQDCGKLWKEASLRHKEGKGQTFTIIVSAGFPIYDFKFGVFLINIIDHRE